MATLFKRCLLGNQVSRILRPLACNRLVLRCVRRHSSNDGVPTVAVVGSGPAGFYTAQQILKSHPTVKVDILEKLPVPFGLVRFGVAPDHPDVKNVINTFTQTAENERCNFFGNVSIGTDVSVAELREMYSAIVFAYGADADRTLGIAGEDLPNVLPARRFVGWYNGLPADKELQLDLNCDTAVILGHGNVALDVARILLTPLDILKKTDISQHALESLAESRVRRVVLAGRRGPLQVAFTIKELREMIRLPDCRTVINPSDVAGIDKLVNDVPRPRRRLTELIYKTGCEPSATDIKLWEKASREWNLRFCISPKEILARPDGKGPEALIFHVNRLEGKDIINKRALPTDEITSISCGLVLRSIGYKSIPIDNIVPFDHSQGIIPNVDSRILGLKGLYCSGWVGRGPVGVILTTMTDAFFTGKVVVKDIVDGLLDIQGKNGGNDLKAVLALKGLQFVTFADWKKIDGVEIAEGNKIGKPREKITDVNKMLNILSV